MLLLQGGYLLRERVPWRRSVPWTLDTLEYNPCGRVTLDEIKIMAPRAIHRPQRLTTDPKETRIMAAQHYQIAKPVNYKGQHYVLVKLHTVIRKDGVPVQIARWRSCCAECHQPFEFSQSLVQLGPPFNRRCQIHKRPGRRVRTGAEKR